MAESKRNRGNGPLEEDGNEAKVLEELSVDTETIERIRCVREETRRAIQHLREMADSIDTTNKVVTTGNIVAAVMNAISCILNGVGIVLSPTTAGASLILGSVGAGFATAAAVSCKFVKTYTEFNLKKIGKTNVTVNACVESIKKNTDKLKCLEASAFQDVLETRIDPKADQAFNRSNAVKDIDPGTFLKRIKELKEITLAKSTGARVLTVILSFLEEMVSIYANITHLVNGAEVIPAAEIRGTANKLEELLLKFNKATKDVA